MPNDVPPICHFCGRPRNEVKNLIESASGACICNGCVEAATKALAQEQKQKPEAATAPLKKPREITALLDTIVIGQEDAKRELAIAVYRHYRRREVSKDGGILLEGERIEIEKSNVLLMGPSGCHRKGQLILMHNGVLQKVEDIQMGDQVMGPDGTSRKVLELHRGIQPMFQVIPTKGQPWVVNQGHILSLVRTNYNGGHSYRKVNEIVDVPITEWIQWTKTQKDVHKLFRVGINFQGKTEGLLDPYFLGVLLGDGSITASTPGVSTTDLEILVELHEQALKYGLKVRPYIRKSKCPFYRISSGKMGGFLQPNPISIQLRKLGLLGTKCENKFIPHIYKVATVNDRLALLAGLLDTDGSLNSNCFEFSSKSQQLSEDVAFLARSLGLAAYPKPSVKKAQTGPKRTYYRVLISGDTYCIPVKVMRKRASLRRQNKNVLRTGLSVKKLSPEKFYGFTVDGDHRYLLGDFTVTHNSGKTLLARAIAKMLDVPFYVADCTRLTQAGYVGDDVETVLQGLLADAQQNIEWAQWGIVFLDEFDKLARKSGRSASGYRDVTGEGVQQALLKLIEGSKVPVPRGMGMRSGMAPVDTMDTSNILFIAAGSFAGIEEIIDRRLNLSSGIGFGKELCRNRDKTEIYKNVETKDVEEFGLIPEIVGRLPVLVSTYELTEGELVRILVEPKNALCKQFRALFSLDGIELQFDQEALLAIAKLAQKRTTGARALRTIMEKILKPYTYEASAGSNTSTIHITKAEITE